MEVQLERSRPQKEVSKTKKSSWDVTTLQEEKVRSKVRPTWQREKSKGSRELCLEKIRERFATQRMRERQRKCVTATEARSTMVKRMKEKTLLNGNLYYNVAELQNIVKQSCKERLHLERHLARATEAAHRSSQIDVIEYQTLQKSNETLRQKLEELHRTAIVLQDAEVRLGERESELQELRAELSKRRELCADLEHQLHETLGKQEAAEKHSFELEKQLQELQPVNEECEELRESLEVVESRFKLAKSEVESLQGKVDNLETLVKQLKEAADKRKELEKQHAEAVAELQKKQEEVQHLHHSNKTEKQQTVETVQSLESKVRELQKKCELQNVLHEELVLEMATLRRSQVKQAWRSQRSHSADMPSETSRLDQEVDLYLVGSDTIFSSNRSHSTLSSLPILDPISSSHSLNPSADPFSSLPATSPGSTVAVTPGRTSSPSSASSNLLNSTSHEIDRILARIEQDNRILAELERSRATVGSPVSTANIERLKAQFEEDQRQLEEITHRTNMKTSVTMRELDVLMAKLEQDNRILAELDRKRATIGMSSIGSLSSQPLYPGSRRPFSATPPGSRSSTPLTGTSSVSGVPGTSPAVGSGNYSSTLPTLPSGAPYGTSSQRREEDIYDDIDYIDLPHRGRCKVFVSRYSYDPLKQSPNENPEAELCLSAGDYILIFGDMDEDGFFTGELLDGRKGLVPSNFVEKLTGEDLFEFQSQVLYGNRDSDDSSASFTYADGDFPSDDMHILGSLASKVSIEDYHRMNDYIDLEDIEELDEDDLSDLEREEGPVPPPQRLILERQLNKSILIGWMHPDAPRGSVEAYHVYVDGVPKATIRSSEKTRALVEGVDSNRPHRISVRSVNPSGRHSRDAACTIVIGKDIPLAPSCVKASNVASTSAVISWLPSNSNFQHVVAINSVEVKMLKPGTFRHTITGLSPNTTYRVSVRARPARLFFNNENPKKLGMLTATVEFRTLPKGLPEPPLDIQVEPGPQDGTLLVTWLPVTINIKGTSNGTPVTGYAVFAGERKISEIDSPTGDHALLDMALLAPLKKRTVTVRTKSGDSLSTDSMPCVIPLELLKGVAATMMQAEINTENNANEDGEREKDRDRPPRERKRSTGSSDSESDTELAELLKHVARRAEAFDPAESSSFGQQGARVEDLLTEEGMRSELSDIAEEPEEDLTHNIERNERKSQQMKDNRPIIRDPDRRSERNSDRRDDYRDDRRDTRREDRIDDRRDIRRDDRRDDRIDDRRDMRREDRRDDRREPYVHDRREQDTTRTTKNFSRPTSDPRSHEKQHGRISPPTVGGQRDLAGRERSYGNRFATDGPISQRRLNSLGLERRNSAGQVIIEPDENLSDKEIYPQAHHVIPSIEITRDNEAINVEDEYLRGNRRGHYSDPHKARNTSSQYYRNERDTARATSPTPPVRHHRDQDNSYYGHRGHSRTSRDDYHGNGYRGRSGHRSRPIDVDGKARLFMALYDYDPQTMSPNPEGAEDELSFQEGQIIKQVYGDKDADGFFRGEANGRVGYVPYNMVSEIQIDDEEAGRQIMNENVYSRHYSGDPNDPWSTLPVRKLVALYDYDPQELSPNVDAEMELAFRTGDVIFVYGGVDEDGFYMGELNGVRGLVPSNFLTEAPPDFRDTRTERLGPTVKGNSGNYPREQRENSQYPRESRSTGYSSSGAPKEHMPSDKGRYPERANAERSAGYERSSGHATERDRGQYSNSGRSGQHW